MEIIYLLTISLNLLPQIYLMSFLLCNNLNSPHAVPLGAGFVGLESSYQRGNENDQVFSALVLGTDKKHCILLMFEDLSSSSEHNSKRSGTTLSTATSAFSAPGTLSATYPPFSVRKQDDFTNLFLLMWR